MVSNMVVAIAQIAVGKKLYKEGEAVTGLSALDMEWMEREGLIKISPDPKPAAKKGKKNDVQGDPD